ncbi:DUF262 domain-containing protein [Magnetospirillum gryphiswaldense]|uniref:GmrSD restriction endonucleases N-terminal domain-containing protein n=1 Tax=Magnetospirillum gryphiswaldense TaxID=55518 RepID=A4U331_9PROT|nr:DUF262 domain-containing protein [Magnetospirillum gryphiswaldense]AVM75808.1 hypothetical protein MSR1_33450 [Magnetospirillum gryphiswaldense MSR-1]AVM79711.1 hypothetical protein MSR1L_33450 [Magnetospirillum gryphiswaldense]CAM77288.1 Protein of unknown function DUF262 [Magnetospirillum gryphiswaldense MSR-1]
MERVDYESLIISDLLGYNNSKSLDITPWYQRRSVWQTPQKAYLINTLFERKPVPSIYIRQQIDLEHERSIKEVVDGQQRIRTIVSYRADEFAAKHPSHRSRVKYSELTPQQKTSFLSTSLSVGYLIGATDQDVIEIFGRINSVAKTLNPMEKLNAMHSGDFKQFCLNQAVSRLPFWRSSFIFSANDIARMQEVQFISDLAIALIEGLGDYSPTKIKKYYKDFDEYFPHEEDIDGRMESIFRMLVAIPAADFSDTIFKSAQIAFSLMVVLDARRAAPPPTDRIRQVIRDIDSAVTFAADGAERSDPRLLAGFTGGNLHRIKTRLIRDEVLKEALA